MEHLLQRATCFLTELGIVNIGIAIKTVAASMRYIEMDPHPNYQRECTIICRGSVSFVENSLSVQAKQGHFSLQRQ